MREVAGSCESRLWEFILEKLFIFHPLFHPFSLEPIDMLQFLPTRKITCLPPSNNPVSYSSYPRVKSGFFLATLSWSSQGHWHHPHITDTLLNLLNFVKKKKKKMFTATNTWPLLSTWHSLSICLSLSIWYSVTMLSATWHYLLVICSFLFMEIYFLNIAQILFLFIPKAKVLAWASSPSKHPEMLFP